MLCLSRKKTATHMVLVSFLISLWCPFHDGNKTLFLMKCKLLLFHFVKDHELFRYTRRYYSYWKILLLGERSNTPAKINERIFRMTLFPTFMSSIDVFKNRMFIVLLWLEWLTHENILITLEFLLIDSFPFALRVFLILEFQIQNPFGDQKWDDRLSASNLCFVS